MNRKVKYILSIFLSVLGFAIAALLNVVIPQKAAGVTFEKHPLLGLSVDSNQAYRAVLYALIIGYIIAGIIDYRFDIRRKNFKV